MLIHFIRHTTPDIDTGICYGQSDLDLADSFDDERKTVMNKLLDQYDIVYTSPLQRCSRLAEFVKTERRVSDVRLMEYNFGDWEMQPWADFKSAEAQNWMTDFVDQPAPNGENILSMQQRVDAFFSDIVKNDYEPVAVVTHSGVLRLIHAHILGTPLDKMFRLQLEFGAVLQVNVDQQTEFLTLRHL